MSAFTNDAGYITQSQVPAQVNADWNATTGAAQILNKPELFSGDYNDLSNKPTIPTVPTDISVFNNDAGYITAQDIPEIPTVPTNVSAFNNDVGYITNTGNNCANSIDLCALALRLDSLENQVFNLNVETNGVTEVSQNSFTVNGTVTADGGSPVTQRGFVYATAHNPTVANYKIICRSGLGTFSTTIGSLNPGTTYYVRAYATNTFGTFYGSEVAVTTTATSPSSVPSVTTIAVTNVTKTQATVSGNVTSDGGETVTQRGFAYDTLPNPNKNKMVATNGSGVGNYTNILNNLFPGKTYYIRAFATNSMGTSYGNELTFTTVAQTQPAPVGNDGQSCPSAPTVTDHEGNVYNTVLIGTQCWTRENLRTTTSPSTGTYLIPPAGTGATFTGKQACWYNNDSAAYAPMNYGLLYNWNAAVDTFNVEYGETSVIPFSSYAQSITFMGFRRGICPHGLALAERCGMVATDGLCGQCFRIPVRGQQQLHSQGLGFHHRLGYEYELLCGGQ